MYIQRIYYNKNKNKEILRFFIEIKFDQTISDSLLPLTYLCVYVIVSCVYIML